MSSKSVCGAEDMLHLPFWLVSEKGKSEFRKVDFEWIYPHRTALHSVGLIFALNSYRIYDDGTFSINGGVRLQTCSKIHSPEMVCIRRHTKTFAVGERANGTEMSEEVTYLLGFQSKDIEGGKIEIYVHISPNGEKFKWVKER